MNTDAVYNKNDAFIRQLFMVLIVSTSFFINGCINGWITPALPKLMSGMEGIKITSNEGSMLALYPEFGHFIAPIPIGLISDLVGRKPVYIFSGLLALTGWAFTFFADNIKYLTWARVILGFVFGINCTLGHIYLSEICSKYLRGRFCCMVFIFNNVGILVQFVIGSYFSTKISSLLGFVFAVIFFLQTWFLVESPYYLLSRKKKVQAKKNFMWLQGILSKGTTEDFKEIVEFVQTRKGFIESFRNLISKSNYKGFVLCILISFLTDLSGRCPILTYAKENFVNDNFISANNFMILLGVFIVVTGIIPTILSDKIGRKIAIVTTTAIGCVMQLSTGTLYFLHDEMKIKIFSYGLLLFITVTGYMACWSIFIANVLTLRGELISNSSRGLASGFTSMAFAFACMISIKMFQVFRDNFGICYGFWTLGIVTFVFALFSWKFLSETKNLTLREIQKNLKNSSDA